jgi:hypothetical protein
MAYFANYYTFGCELPENRLFGIIEQKTLQTNKFYTFANLQLLICKEYPSLCAKTIVCIEVPELVNVFVGNDYYLISDYAIVNYVSVDSFLYGNSLIAQAIVHRDANSFQFLPESFRGDLNIAKIAVQKNFRNYEFLPRELQKNKQLADTALSLAIGDDCYEEFAQMLHKELANDYDFCKLILGKIYNFARG